MVQVDFHFNAPEKWAYVGRLLRKISGQGKRTFVCGPQDALERLHQNLWQLNPSDFVTNTPEKARLQTGFFNSG